MADPVVGVRHVPGAGLDPREDDLDLVLPVVHAVEEPDGTVPRVAEQVRHLLPDEVLDDEVGATDLGHRSPLGRGSTDACIISPQRPRGQTGTVYLEKPPHGPRYTAPKPSSSSLAAASGLP